MALLEGKTALVTGAGSGIGKETAILLADGGARVALVGRQVDALEEVKAQIAAGGGTATVHPTHVERQVEVKATVSAVRSELGPVDILVCCAGSASKVLNVQYISEQEWNEVIGVNLNAVYFLTQAVLPDMLDAGGGTIITVSSLAAVRPNLLGGAAYGAAKAGVRNLMTFVHNTFRNQGIRATTILPGEVNTPIMNSRAQPPARQVRERMVQPEHVAEAIVLCASLPGGTVIEELVIAPTHMRDTSSDIESSRWVGAPSQDAPQTVA